MTVRTKADSGESTTSRIVAPDWKLPLTLTDPRSGSALARSWLATRGLSLTLLTWLEIIVSGDVTYYGHSLSSMFTGAGIRHTLQEYPVPVLGVMVPQFLISARNDIAFAMVFTASMLIVDAGITMMLWRASGRRRDEAVTFWLWFLPAIGPMAYFRFDILPGALAAGVVLMAARRPALAGVFTALGAGLKLWPAIMLPILLVRRAGQRAVLISALSTGALIALVSLLCAGGRRLISPLSWQDARGLQIESVPAVPLMLARAVHSGGIWNVHESKYKSAEIFGAGVTVMVALSTVATIAAIIYLGVLVLRARTMQVVSAQTMGWLLLAAALLITVTNKTLSPQYLVWIGAPLAALLIFRHVAGQSGGAAQSAGRCLMTSAVLTQIIYPVKYRGVTDISGQTFVITSLLALRNILLCYVTYIVCREAWRHTRHDRASEQASASESFAEQIADSRLHKVGETGSSPA